MDTDCIQQNSREAVVFCQSPPRIGSVSAPLALDGSALRLVDVARVARHGARITIEPGAFERLQRSRRTVEDIIPSGLSHYGINTGFGSLARQRIAPNDLRVLQRNLVRSHASGVGAPLPTDTVRAMMLILAASLCRGYSGVRDRVLDHIAALLNASITPVVPSLGSVGASGDLAPLAHIALVLMGEGRAVYDGLEMDASDALRHAGLPALELEGKEGLALINGTHLMAAAGALICHDVRRLFDAALAACAMSIDAVKATDAFLDARIYTLRNHAGPERVARILRAYLADSQVVASHRIQDTRVQDPYSFRCAAIVLGAVDEALAFVTAAIERELGAVTDNPLIMPEGDIISGGNFHGMPVALPLDVLAIGLTHLAGISQQRTFALLAAREPESGLTAYLTPQPGLSSGLMVTQYAAAACCNEMIGLSTPASVANVQTSAGIEDYNSFGPRAAAKARRALELATHVVAIELLCAAQGLDAHRPLRSGSLTEAAHAHIRRVVPALSVDRSPAPDIATIGALIDAGTFTFTP